MVDDMMMDGAVAEMDGSNEASTGTDSSTPPSTSGSGDREG